MITFVTKRKLYEESILKHIVKLVISNKSIDFAIFNDTLVSLIKKTHSLWYRLLLSEIAKYGEYTSYQQEDIKIDQTFKKAKDDWNEKFIDEISDPSVCRICFRIICNSKCWKFIDLRRYEYNLLDRVKSNEKKFIDFGNANKTWIKFKYETKKKLKRSINLLNKSSNKI